MRPTPRGLPFLNTARIIRWCSEHLNALLSYGVSVALGLLVFHVLYNATLFLDPNWGFGFPNDLAQHAAGYYALRSTPWGLPLLYANVLGYPQGFSAYFTDSIPLLALPFKLLAPLFAPEFHYFKWWMLAAFVLQPLAATYLIRTLGFRQVSAAACAAGFSLLVKWLIFRTEHPALLGQFLILVALAFYFQSTRAGRPARLKIGRWLVLVAAAFLVHLYLFVMVMGIFFAAVLDFPAGSRARIAVLLYKANLILLPVLLFPILYGIFASTNSALELPPADGFGYFSLNLSGPFYGGRLIALPAWLGPTEGQRYEDQSYLGLGVIVLLLLALVLGRKTIFPLLKRHLFLALLLVGFTIFALSSDVYLGVERIYRYPPALTRWIIASPFAQLRASARFFWPAGYALLFFGLATLLKRRWALPVLAVLLLVQWTDLPKPYTPRPAGYAQAYNPDLAYWDALLENKRALYLYPTRFCGGDSSPENIPILMMAAQNGVLSNTVFITRYEEDCQQKTAAGLADRAPGSVHIFTTPATPLSEQALLAFDPAWCARRAEISICLPEPTAAERELLEKIDTLLLPERSPLEFPHEVQP